MNGFLVLLLLTGLWRPEALPIGARELQTACELAGQPLCIRTAARVIDWEEAVPGKLVIGYSEGSEADARALVKAAGGVVTSGSVAGGSFIVAKFPKQDRSGTNELIASLQQNPVVRFAEPEIRCRALFTPNDPYYARYQWGNWVMYADRAWDLTTGSRDVKVGIVDEGVDYTHPDLAACFDPGTRGYDFVDKDADPRPTGSEEMHGSHVAGIVAAGNNNAVGIAGWANVTLYSCRALDSAGSGSTSDIADGVRWATDHGVRVINLSLGSVSSSSVLEDAVRYAWDRGVVLVAASGNDGARAVFFPAAYDQCIAVGAFDTTGVLAGFSNYGPEQELVAPGVGILSTTPGSEYYYMDGTSMASPEVAGLVALLIAYRPTLTNQQVRAILSASAIDMGTAGRDEYYGYGLANGFRALQLAQMYGADLEPARALGRRPVLPSLVRAADFPRLLPEGAIVLDALGRTPPAAIQPGVYFVRCAGSSISVAKITVAE
jgi:serine protease